MKNKILKSIFALVMTFMTMPMMGQDYLKLYFKDGHTERHFMNLVKDISATRYDLEGNLHSDYQMQQIVMEDTTYSYYIEDIDSMTFRKVDEEQIKKDIADVVSNIEPIFIQCPDSLTISQYLDQIQNLKGVEKVSLTEKDLMLFIKDSYPIIYPFSHNDASIKNYDTFSSYSPIRQKSPELRYPNKNSFVLNQTYKIAFLNQQSNDRNRDFVYTNVNDIVQEYANIPNLIIKYIPSEKLTDDFFSNEIYSYDIIYLNTHGGYDKKTKKHWILTGEEISVNKAPGWWDETVAWWKDRKADLDEYRLSYSEEGRLNKEGTLSTVPVWYVDISEDRIKKSNNLFKKDHNTIFFDAACSNLEGEDELIRENNGKQDHLKGNESMARMFVDNKNVDVFLGYNDWSNYLKDFYAFKYFLEYLLNGLSEEAAMNQLLLEHNLDVFNDIENNLVDQHNMMRILITGHYKMDNDASDLLYHFEENVFNQLGEIEFYEACKLITEMLDNLKAQGVEPFTLEHIQNIINEINLSVEINYGSESDHSKHIPYKFNREWICNLIDVADNKDIFLTSTNTKNLIQEEVDKEFKANGKVTINGFTSVLNLEESPIKCGFRFGDDPNLKNYVEVILNPENYKEVSNELGNVEFSFELEPAPGQKLYYRAITFDGIHYNLANEICSFKAPEIPHLSLSANTLTIESGTSCTVDITSGSGSYSIDKIEPEGVVTVNISENRIFIEALKAGTATITVKDDKSGETVSFDVTVEVKDIPSEAIDLGLPSGTLWASYNVGATKPEEYGGYYAWGETEEKNFYMWKTYLYCDGTEAGCYNLGTDIAGTEYDVAYMKWGGSWRMPNIVQLEELKNECTWSWTTINDISVVEVTGLNGNSIYIPAADCKGAAGLEGLNLWSSSLDSSESEDAMFFHCSGSYFLWMRIDRCIGFNVRPVIPNNSTHPQASKLAISIDDLTFNMIKVDGAAFWMGSENGYDEEKPVHKVTLGDYYIGETEVTQELWEAVMGSNPSKFQGSRKLPVENVSWDDCQTFVSKLNKLTGKKFRLPTEAEWEFAARGGLHRKGCKYSGDNTIDNVAWYEKNSSKKTHDVATKNPNELGIYDMSGNVWEWCQDWNGNYGSEPQTNPTGPITGTDRIFRGGSWTNNAKTCTVSTRYWGTQDHTSYVLGLRLAL